LNDTASKIAEAPDGSHAWELYFCERCHYTWRDIEPDFITDIAKRDPWAQLSDKEGLEGIIETTGSDYITFKERPTAEEQSAQG
jgi:hypothetical protein